MFSALRDRGPDNTARSARSPTRRDMNAYLSAHENRGDPYVIISSGPFACFWNVIIAVAIVINIWASSLTLAYDAWTSPNEPLPAICEIIFIGIFCLDIAISFNTSYTTADGREEKRRSRICRKYIQTWLVLDVLSVVPWEAFASDGVGAVGRNSKVLKLLKLGKFIRILKLVRNDGSGSKARVLLEDTLGALTDSNYELEGWLEALRLAYGICQFSTLLLLESHLVACCVMSLLDSASVQWIEFSNSDFDNHSGLVQYLTSMQWALVAFVAGGPDTGALKLEANPGSSVNIRFMKGMFPFAFFINFLLLLYIYGASKSVSETSYGVKVQLVNQQLRKRQVAGSDRSKVLNCLRARQTQEKNNITESVLQSMPHSVRKNVCLQMNKAFFMEAGFFRKPPFSQDDRFLRMLCDKIETRVYDKSEYLVEQGVNVDALMKLLQGELVKITNERWAEARRGSQGVYSMSLAGREEVEGGNGMSSSPDSQGVGITDGSYFGMQCLCAPADYQEAEYSVQAALPSYVFALRRTVFYKAMAKIPEWVRFMEFVREEVQSEFSCGERGARKMDELDDWASEGLPEKLQQKWASKEIAFGVPRSEDLGISCRYLLNDFANDVFKETGLPKDSDPSYSDLGKMFWDPALGKSSPGFKGSQQKMCPRDGMVGCAIVDAVERDCAALATHFLSWSWSYSIGTVSSAISLWCEQFDPTHERVFFWMCFFCNNQRQIFLDETKVVPSGDLEKCFGERLKLIGNAVLLLDDYDHPSWATRIWCIFEAFTATMNDVPITVALPCRMKEKLNDSLAKGEFTDIARSLTHVNAEQAVATIKADEENIKRKIKDTCGFAKVDSMVKFALSGWLSSAFQDFLLESSYNRVRVSSSAKPASREACLSSSPITRVEATRISHSDSIASNQRLL